MNAYLIYGVFNSTINLCAIKNCFCVNYRKKSVSPRGISFMKSSKLFRSVVIFSILFILSQIYIVSGVYNKVVYNISQQALHISKTVALNIDIDKYIYIAKHKEKNLYFYEMQNYFKKAQEINEVKYIYIHKFMLTTILLNTSSMPKRTVLVKRML